MKVKLIGKSSLVSLTLPQRVYGNYWITNEYKENLINIEALDNKWIIKSNSDIKIIENNNIVESKELIENHFYHFYDVTTDEEYRIFVGETFDSKMLMLDFTDTDNFDFTIGNSSSSEGGSPNYISYENDNIHYNQLSIKKTNGYYLLKNLNTDVNVYVNNNLVSECYIKYGDVIFLEGLTFSLVGNTLLLGTVGNKVKYVTSKFKMHEVTKLDYSSISNNVDNNVELFLKSDYYVRPPRFSEMLEEKEINVDNPPKKEETDQMPVILTLGPMVIMGMSSSVAGFIALSRVLAKKESFADNYAPIITAICMIIAMLVFPSAQKAYQKHRQKKREKLRQEKYHNYLTNLDNEIKEELIHQKRILTENNLPLNDVGDIILYKKRNLWERKYIHRDFLNLRLGNGNIAPLLRVNYQKEHFHLEEDNLEDELKEIIKKNSVIEDVPVTFNFREKRVSAIIGKENQIQRFVDGLILQMMAYHSYDELKIVILTNSNNEQSWDSLKNSPYLWNSDRSLRYFATNTDELSRVSAELEEQFTSRNSSKIENKEVLYAPHYFIITDDISLASKVGIVNDILSSSSSLGFSLLYLTDKLNSLPSECSSFISIDGTTGGVFENELSSKKQEFKPEYIDLPLDSYVYASSNIPLESGAISYELPTMYSFMEMYDVGNVLQLNSYNRWIENDPTSTLSCPVGVSENGEVFKLDLHEKVHGPHGLIAGMTGSGKSEFIITYILSMAINYSPNEVQFVLIDYKGGGLAGAFENKETGFKLPHLAGTITNLDVNEINRSLSSLQSELKRRQKIFNEARDLTNESTIDIYKYQKLYREKKVKEPIAHLFIICDEFAELKADRPEFMDELISAARIGRSLGVHLILATQKPSGVVDDQIWSNSKFRICLKVQDKSDSNDMIKSPEAAYIKETGRFYLQVGFNEFFAKGQSAWAGAPYYESDKRKKYTDNSLSFVDNIGGVVKSVDTDKGFSRGIHKGEEIGNILKYLSDIGNSENIHVKKLWLDALKDFILVDNLKRKYNYRKENFVINPLIGEIDAPMEQKQDMLTLPLTKEGNLLIYGTIGSGKENLVSTIIYSIITTYLANEINLYVLDFGSGALRAYSKAPQVGGIVSASDKDKIATLIKMLREKIETRKKLFADYNGSYEYYIKKSGKTVPTIITFINGFESFNELYPEFADDLILLTREGQKYGVLFIVTVSSASNIRMKVSQNFNDKLVLQMNDEFDYRQILGRTELVPGKVSGRGLVKRDNIYEFQSAYPCDMADISNYMPKVIENILKSSLKRAERIPTLPEKVTTSFVSSELDGLYKVPIGVEKETLKIASVDLKSTSSMLVSSSKITNTKDFVNSLIYELSILRNTGVYVIDAEKLLTDNFNNVKYYKSSFDKVFTSFKNIIEDLNNTYVKSGYDNDSLSSYGDMVFVIIGINKIKTILGAEFDNLVANSIMMSKKLSKICYVFVDQFDNLKKLEYDLWYKDIVNSTRGIWIGNGLAEQTIFKLFASSKSVADNIPSNFGYNIVSGIPTLFKYIEDIDGTEMDEL